MFDFKGKTERRRKRNPKNLVKQKRMKMHRKDATLP
jgi:hypothetical protein